MQFCNKDISKTIKSIMSRLLGENLKKKLFYFFELLPFANFDMENLISQKYYS